MIISTRAGEAGSACPPSLRFVSAPASKPPGMATRVLLTIDTELVWRHHKAGLGWKENFARSYEAAGVGIPYQLGLLAEHGLKACFFVDPMPAMVHGLEPVRRMVDPILAAGQEVQLHLHPFWSVLERAEQEGACPELASFGRAEQRAMIIEARELLMAAGVHKPVAFRAGSYAADAATLSVLAELGFRYDSSHNGSHHPVHSRLPFDPMLVTPRAAGGVVEIPVGQVEESPGNLRHLQICAVSFRELSAALEHGVAQRHPVTTIVGHGFELATRDGLRINRIVRDRFVRLCRFLAERRETMPTAWFTELEGLPLDAAGTPLAGSVTPRLRRIASQMWGNTLYEQRGAAAVAASAAAAAAAIAADVA